jgi:tetratricopeptide (TPR) repeat protein
MRLGRVARTLAVVSIRINSAASRHTLRRTCRHGCKLVRLSPREIAKGASVMIGTRSFKQKLSKIVRQWADKHYDLALGGVEQLLKSWPGNAQLHILWASLVQLQEQPVHSLDEVKMALERAMELDKRSPAAAIELGHYLDAVEDDHRAASKVFSEGIRVARSLLIEGLVGQARALLEIDKRDEALQCLVESLYLANIDQSYGRSKSADGVPDVLVRDLSGRILALQLKGPFALKIEDLLQDLFPKRSA